MSPKKALLILSPFIVLLILTFVMIFISQNKKNIATKSTVANMQDKAGNQLTGTSSSAAEVFEKAVDEKIQEKRKEIETKPADKPYTQDQVDFLLNPRKTVEKELIDENKNINDTPSANE